jgi:hypothetical protein
MLSFAAFCNVTFARLFHTLFGNYVDGDSVLFPAETLVFA